MKKQWLSLLALMTLAAGAPMPAQQGGGKQRPRPVTRLFVQDLGSSSLHWVDVKSNERGEFTLGPPIADLVFSPTPATGRCRCCR